MNLICYAQEKYFVCTGKIFRVHRKKNSCAQQKEFVCTAKKFRVHSKKKLLLAYRKFTTCPCSNSYLPIP